MNSTGSRAVIPLQRNLAPADVPKDGTAYDVAIAVGILAASGQLPDLGRLADRLRERRGSAQRLARTQGTGKSRVDTC